MSDTAENTDATAAEDTAADDVTEEATRMGWRPIEQFKGDKSKFIEPDEFVRRGREILPIVQASNKAMEKSLKAAREQIAEMETTFAKFQDHHSKTAKREYDRALADLRARQEQAAEVGDVEGVRKATDGMIALEKEVEEAPKAKPADKPAVSEEQFEAWVADNPWYKTDAALRGACREIAQEVYEATGLTGVAQMAEVTKRVKAEFPSKFANPRRQQPGAVEGGGLAPRGGGRSYSDLPADAKAICDDFVKNIKGFTREQYVKDFDWPAR